MFSFSKERQWLFGDKQSPAKAAASDSTQESKEKYNNDDNGYESIDGVSSHRGSAFVAAVKEKISAVVKEAKKEKKQAINDFNSIYKSEETFFPPLDSLARGQVTRVYHPQIAKLEKEIRQLQIQLKAGEQVHKALEAKVNQLYDLKNESQKKYREAEDKGYSYGTFGK